MAINAVPTAQRGSVLATVAAFFDVGLLTSALGLGGVNQLLGLRFGFTVAAATSASGLLVLAPWRRGCPAADRPIDPT